MSKFARSLCRHRILPKLYLRGGLAESEFTVYARPLASGRIDSPGEFWQALGGRPRPFFNYTAILAVPIGMPEVSTQAVKASEVKLGRETPEEIEKKRAGGG